MRLLRRSDLIESEPVDAEGPDYLNCVAEVKTELAPLELLDFTQEVERALGRSGKGTNAPRPIDIDILLYGDVVVQSPGLSIPHPRLHERAFVLGPLCSLEPSLTHPVSGKSMAELMESLSLLRSGGSPK